MISNAQVQGQQSQLIHALESAWALVSRTGASAGIQSMQGVQVTQQGMQGGSQVMLHAVCAGDGRNCTWVQWLQPLALPAPLKPLEAGFTREQSAMVVFRITSVPAHVFAALDTPAARGYFAGNFSARFAAQRPAGTEAAAYDSKILLWYAEGNHSALGGDTLSSGKGGEGGSKSGENAIMVGLLIGMLMAGAVLGGMALVAHKRLKYKVQMALACLPSKPGACLVVRAAMRTLALSWSSQCKLLHATYPSANSKPCQMAQSSELAPFPAGPRWFACPACNRSADTCASARSLLPHD